MTGAAVLGVLLLVFVLGVVIYVLGSFALLRSHAARRSSRHWLAALVGETFFAGLIQPLLPLYYLLGRRLGGASGGVPIVFCHGYMQNRVGFIGLARALARRNLGPLYGFNYPWYDTLAANAARLERFVAQVCAETGAPEVDLVCHSMGGLVAIEMMRDEARRDALAVRRCVTIATPHGGVVWRGPLLGFGASSLRRGSELLAAHAAAPIPVPVLSIYSTHDNIVHPKETSSLAARGGRDLEIEGPGHFAILFSSAVAAAVADFLEEPEVPAVTVVETAETVGETAQTPAAEEA